MKEIRILFTGVGRRVELMQAFRAAAFHTGCRLRLYGADMTFTAPALFYCDGMRQVCSMRDPDYIPELVRICRDDAIDLVIPTIDTDLLILSEHTADFAAAVDAAAGDAGICGRQRGEGFPGTESAGNAESALLQSGRAVLYRRAGVSAACRPV